MFQSISEFISNTNALMAHLEYERSSQLYFQNGFKKYTGDSELEVEFRRFVENKISPSLVNLKTFTYQNAIISLYGYLERFIENIIEEYLRNVSEACAKFNRLPPAVRKNHFSSSLDFLLKIQRNKGITSEQRKLRIVNVVKNMYSCLQEEDGYLVNYDAFLMHNSNFRYDSIQDIFNRVGIKSISRRCLEINGFVKSISQKHNISEDVDRKLLITLLISELDDLAQRRNEIAHGVRLDEIESIPLLLERISLIRAYGLAINNVVTEYFALFSYESSNKICIGKASRVFNRVRVIGFDQCGEKFEESSVRKVKIGDQIFAVNEQSSKKIIAGKIISMKKEGVAVLEIDIPSNVTFTFEVDFAFNDNMLRRFFYIATGP